MRLYQGVSAKYDAAICGAGCGAARDGAAREAANAIPHPLPPPQRKSIGPAKLSGNERDRGQVALPVCAEWRDHECDVRGRVSLASGSQERMCARLLQRRLLPPAAGQGANVVFGAIKLYGQQEEEKENGGPERKTGDRTQQQRWTEASLRCRNADGVDGRVRRGGAKALLCTYIFLFQSIQRKKTRQRKEAKTSFLSTQNMLARLTRRRPSST